MDLALNNLQWLICHKTKPNINEYINVIHKMIEEKKRRLKFAAKGEKIYQAK